MENDTHAYPEGSLWISGGEVSYVNVIDQRLLPFREEVFRIHNEEEAFYAIREMVVRGAPLIGVTAAFGMYLAALNAGSHAFTDHMEAAARKLNASRPTAVNLFYATARMLAVIDPHLSREENTALLFREACSIREEEIESCRSIGISGLPLIEEIFRKNGGKPVQVLTHCNAGWLACVKWGTATAPLYMAHEKGIPLHIWVDETRPRNQGARLTAFELGLAGIPHTVIPDNSGGHLMQHGRVDLVLVGSDRTTLNGDVANKSGTYLKALAAFDNRIPFYAALPSSTIDWESEDGIRDIPIEERSSDEVAFIEGWSGRQLQRVRLIPPGSPAVNFGFDVTPARLVTGLITERGICTADRKGIRSLFPER